MEKIKLEFVPYKEFAIDYHKKQEQVRKDNLEWLASEIELNHDFYKRGKILKDFTREFKILNDNSVLYFRLNRGNNNISISKKDKTIELNAEELRQCFYMINWSEGNRRPISKNRYSEMQKIVNLEIEFDDIYEQREILCNLYKYIKQDLRKMPYRDFLKTTYWEIIRRYRLRGGLHPCCELCGTTKEKLVVHHYDYSIRGFELYSSFNDYGLTVLCDSCHKKFHGIEG